MNLSVTVALIIIVSAVVLYSRSSVSAPQSPDGQVIAQLAKAGSNLSKPHNIEFFLYFPNQQSAEKIAVKLNSDGFSTTVKQSASSKETLLQAQKPMLPVESELAALREKLNTLSASEGGVYDGWGTEIEK
jgi:regulator of RNase E activity RraB